MAPSDIDNGSLRRFALPAGGSVCAAAIFAAIWFSVPDFVLHATTSAAVGAELECAPLTAVPWSASGTSGDAWTIATNLASCDEVDRFVRGLLGKSIVDLPEVAGFRCTTGATKDGQVLTGICYAIDPPSGYFSWGANIAPYDHPGPCDRCTGVPGEHPLSR
jgi:hypothetical protein